MLPPADPKALMQAATDGDSNAVALLLKAGTDVHAADDRALRNASFYGHLSVVEVLVTAGANVHADNDYALRFASRNGHLSVVKVLVKAGANVHAGNDAALRFASFYGHLSVVEFLKAASVLPPPDPQALIAAAKTGDSKTVALLLKAGTDVHANDDEALYMASKNGHLPVVEVLVTAGANVHAGDDYALCAASYYGHLSVVEFLVQAGANVHADDALLYASQNGHLPVVKFLVKAGADVHAQGDEAIRLASSSGHLPVVDFLVKAAQAAASVLPSPDPQALMQAATDGDSKTVALLLKAGTDVHAADDQALRNASFYGHLSVVEVLVTAGANVHADNDYALRFASRNGHLSVVKVLVKAGANVHAADDEALRYASSSGHLAVVEFLVTAGANVHAADDEALRWASEKGHLPVVEFLVKAGANVHAAGNEALHLASQNGHTAVVAFLVKAAQAFPKAWGAFPKATPAATPAAAAATPAATPAAADVVFPLVGRPVVGFPATPTVCVAEATKLGGTTGATLVRCGTSLYVRKSVPLAKGVVLYNEYMANRIYDLLGVPVPACRFYQTPTDCVLLSEYLTPTEAIKGAPSAVVQALRENFAVDAFLANWDVLGQTMDNVLVYAGVPYRIDVGGALYRRAQGAYKALEDFSFQVVELYSMRCMSSSFKSPHCDVFASLTDAEVSEQIRRIAPVVRTSVLPMVAELTALHSVLQGRIAMMEQWSSSHSRALTQVRTPVAGTESKVAKDAYMIHFKLQIDYLEQLRLKSKDIFAAFKQYVEGTDYAEFNRQLCTGTLPSKFQKLSDGLTTGFFGLPPLHIPILVYRGMNGQFSADRLGCQYVSTSTNRSSAVAFMKGATCCFLHITLPAGVRAFPMRTVGGTMAHEYEVLLPPGGRWIQRGGSYVENGVTIYNYDYIPPGAKYVSDPVFAGMYVVYNDMLLVHKRSAHLGGFLSCPGGSITPPETPAAAAAREAMEEAGVQVLSKPNEFYMSPDGKFVGYVDYVATQPKVSGPNAYSLSEVDMGYDFQDVPEAQVVPGTGHAWVPLKPLFAFLQKGKVPDAQTYFYNAVFKLLALKI